MTALVQHHGIYVPDTSVAPLPGAGGEALRQNLIDMVAWSPKSNWAASADPAASDDENSDYFPGSFWFNASSGAKRLFVCISNAATAAVWHPLLPAGTNGKVIADPAGNARGTGAVDLQVTRTVSTQVANGTNATIAGGTGNTASGNYSFAAGQTCTASGIGSFAAGSANSATASYSTASGINAAATRYGENARASGMFAASGDAQSSSFVVRNTTTNATVTDLFLDGSSQRIVIPTNSTCFFSCNIVGRRTGATVESGVYQIVGVIRNNAGTTVIVGTPVKTILAEDSAPWLANAVASDTNDALVVQVTGEASKTIRWVADVTLVRVGT